MFTGLVQAVGKVIAIKPKDGDAQFVISTGDLDMSTVQLGDSIAVNGVCLTAVKFDDKSFTADVSNETLSCTTLAKLSANSRVNLEKSLTLSTPLGGHLVSGHVDAVGETVERKADARSERFSFKVPAEIQHYIAAKGSVTINGTSLTVNNVADNHFDVNIVPHTLSHTNLGDLKTGDPVNIEVDLLARYVERLLSGKASPSSTDNSLYDTLSQAGFIK